MRTLYGKLKALGLYLFGKSSNCSEWNRENLTIRVPTYTTRKMRRAILMSFTIHIKKKAVKATPRALARKERSLRKNTRNLSGDISCLSFSQEMCSCEKLTVRKTFLSCGLRKIRSVNWADIVIGKIHANSSPLASVINNPITTRKTAHKAAVSRRLLKGFFCSGKTFLMNFFIRVNLTASLIFLSIRPFTQTVFHKNSLSSIQLFLDKKAFLIYIDYSNL